MQIMLQKQAGRLPPAENRLFGGKFFHTIFETLCSRLIVFWLSMRYNKRSEPAGERETEECQCWQWRKASGYEGSAFVWQHPIMDMDKRHIHESREASFRRPVRT